MPLMTVSDIMSDVGMLELSSEETGDAACKRILSHSAGIVGIVRVPSSMPFGVLTRKSYFTLNGLEEKLGEHRELLAPVGLTTPDTELIQIVKTVSLNRGVNWFLAMQEGRVTGYIAPSMLFNLFGTSKSIGQIFVGPHSATSPECYCCQPQPPDSRHRVTPEDAEKRMYAGIKYCPTHYLPLIVSTPPCDDGC